MYLRMRGAYLAATTFPHVPFPIDNEVLMQSTILYGASVIPHEALGFLSLDEGGTSSSSSLSSHSSPPRSIFGFEAFLLLGPRKKYIVGTIMPAKK